VDVLEGLSWRAKGTMNKGPFSATGRGERERESDADKDE